MYAANHYKGTVFEKECDEDSAEEKEIELYLEINLTLGRIVGY